MDSTQLLVIAVVAVAVMGAVWFAVRFWLASTRPADIKDVQTPALDRLNRNALERAAMAARVDDDADEDDEDEELYEDEDADEEAPEGLSDAVPEDERK